MSEEEIKDTLPAAETVAEEIEGIEVGAAVEEALKNTQAEDVNAEGANDTQAVEAEEKYAKSGKKSKKHIEEVKAEEARQARKAETKALEEAGEKPKGAAPVTRPKIERRGKKYQAAAKQIEKKLYTLKDALELAAKTNPSKFDATVDLKFAFSMISLLIVELGMMTRLLFIKVRMTVCRRVMSSM